MSRARVHNFSISLDGYGAGPNQSRDNPLGVGADNLHDWVIATRTWRKMHSEKGGARGIDDEFMARGTVNIGAWIMGRNMFGPIRGAWPDDTWKGWWGDDPPFQLPVCVLTHYPRAPIKTENGTIFHFITDGIHAALKRAGEAAGGKDVLVGGGVATIRQYLQSKLIDEMHLAVAPILLGSGAHLFADLDLPSFGYHCTEHVPTKSVTHVVLEKRLISGATRKR